jgi:hypothetical protein
MDVNRSYSSFILPGTAIFALLWAVARACVQSITIDEADTYLVWVARRDPAHWQAASNNHVLNSLLMRLFTSVFEVSHLSVRAPALLGAAIYILAAYLLCRKLTPDLRTQWPLFVCLVYNPFVFDHLVAARGYALALGFLMCILALGFCTRLEAGACALCSVCAALSFAANFSFAFVNTFLMLAILICAYARTQGTRARLRILASCVLPGLLVSIFLSAPAVLHWPGGELNYGAHSLRQMFSTIAQASLYQPNPQMVNPVLYGLLEHAKPFLLPVLLVLAAWQWAAQRPFAAGALLGILVATICAHWLLFRFFRVPLPMDRTAIWIVPLCTLAIGSAATGRRALTVMLYVMSFYFLLCLRLNYFKEWSWDCRREQGLPGAGLVQPHLRRPRCRQQLDVRLVAELLPCPIRPRILRRNREPHETPRRSLALRPLLSLRRRLHQVPAPASGLPRPRHRRRSRHPSGSGIRRSAPLTQPSHHQPCSSLRFSQRSLRLCVE